MFGYKSEIVKRSNGKEINGFLSVIRTDTNSVVHICSSDHEFASPELVSKMAGFSPELYVIDGGKRIIATSVPVRMEGRTYTSDNYIAIVSDVITGNIIIYGVMRFLPSGVEIAFVIDEFKYHSDADVKKLLLKTRGYATINGSHPYKWTLGFTYVRIGGVEKDMLVKSLEGVLPSPIDREMMGNSLSEIEIECEISGNNLMSGIVGALSPFNKYKTEGYIGWYSGIYNLAMRTIVKTAAMICKAKEPNF